MSNEGGIGETWFPIRVLYDGDTETKLVKHPDHLIDGKSFVVKEVRVKP